MFRFDILTFTVATLTQTAKTIRLTVNVIILAIILFLVFKIAIAVIGKIWNRIHPPEPPKPNYMFGKLPPPKFFEVEIKKSTPTYNFDPIYTPSLPATSTLLPVFKNIPPTPSIQALDRAKSRAAFFGFTQGPKDTTATEYHFEDQKLPRTMTINILTQYFNLVYDYKTSNDFIKAGASVSKAEALVIAKEELSRRSLLPDDMKNGPSEVSLLTLVAGELRTPTKPSDANLARIDLKRADVAVDGLPKNVPANYSVVGMTPHKGPISTIISNSPSQLETQRIIQLAYHYQFVDYNTFGTYAIKNASTAWEEIRNGEGTLVYLQLRDVDQNIPQPPLRILEIIIKNISLAYYDCPEVQKYFEPIYVFEGEAKIEGGRIATMAIYITALTQEGLE